MYFQISGIKYSESMQSGKSELKRLKSACPPARLPGQGPGARARELPKVILLIRDYSG